MSKKQHGAQRKPSPRCPARLRFFTLIELLLVVAVIMILLSLLLPAIYKAKSMALRISCTSNLKQFGQSFLIYADDWNGWFPEDILNGNGNWTYVTLVNPCMNPYFPVGKNKRCNIALDPGGLNYSSPMPAAEWNPQIASKDIMNSNLANWSNCGYVNGNNATLAAYKIGTRFKPNFRGPQNSAYYYATWGGFADSVGGICLPNIKFLDQRMSLQKGNGGTITAFAINALGGKTFGSPSKQPLGGCFMRVAPHDLKGGNTMYMDMHVSWRSWGELRALKSSGATATSVGGFNDLTQLPYGP